MISYRWATDLYGIEKIIHNLTGTNEWWALDSALKLVSSIEDQGMSRILTFDDFDDATHVH